MYKLIPLIFLLMSCEFFEQKSKITPIAQSKNISDRFSKNSNGEITAYMTVPLSTESIGSYTTDMVAEDAKTAVGRALRDLKFKAINTVLKLGIKNRLVYSTDFDLSEVPESFVTSLRVKKMIFTILPCNNKDKDCHKSQLEQETNFTFLNDFFVNISPLKKDDSHLFLSDPVQFVNEDKYERYSNYVFSGRKKRDFNNFRDDQGQIPDSVLYNLNVASFKNDRAYRKKARVENLLKNYIVVSTKEHDQAKDLLKELKDKQFQSVIRNAYRVSHHIFVEVKDGKDKKDFFESFSKYLGKMSDFGVTNYNSCNFATCAKMDVNSVNLMPIRKVSDKMRIDSFLSLNEISLKDFKYVGFILLEVKLKLDF